MNFIWVFLGGGLGAVARYGVSRLVPFSSSGFPYPTLIANVISCIILGFLMGLISQSQLDTRAQLLLATGFCGGFSTFSTFSGETLQLIQNEQIGIAVIYIGVSISLCLLAIFIGLKLSS